MAFSKWFPAAIVAAASLLTACPSGTSCQCGPGETANSFASGAVYCCRAGYPYYCTGTGKCYQTWDQAYYGNSAGCTLPQDRETCPGTDNSSSSSCTPNCAKGTHQVGCQCVPD